MNHDFIYFDEECSITFVCKIYYQPEELGSVDSYGLKNEPDYPAECYIESMYLMLDPRERSILPIIDEGVQEYIVQQFLEEFKSENF
jgi:hypothetical protein